MRWNIKIGSICISPGCQNIKGSNTNIISRHEWATLPIRGHYSVGKDPIHYIAKCNVMFLPACVQLFQRIPSKQGGERRGKERCHCQRAMTTPPLLRWRQQATTDDAIFHGNGSFMPSLCLSLLFLPSPTNTHSIQRTVPHFYSALHLNDDLFQAFQFSFGVPMGYAKWCNCLIIKQHQTRVNQNVLG